MEGLIENPELRKQIIERLTALSLEDYSTVNFCDNACTYLLNQIVRIEQEPERETKPTEA